MWRLTIRRVSWLPAACLRPAAWQMPWLLHSSAACRALPSPWRLTLACRCQSAPSQIQQLEEYLGMLADYDAFGA